MTCRGQGWEDLSDPTGHGFLRRLGQKDSSGQFGMRFAGPQGIQVCKRALRALKEP